MDMTNDLNNPSMYTLCNMGRPSGSLHLMKVQLTHDPGTQAYGFPCCTPIIRMPLNDAFLVRLIAEGPTRNEWHVTMIDILGKRRPNLDPGVFYSKVWNKRWVHAKLQKTLEKIVGGTLLECSYLVDDFNDKTIKWRLMANPKMWLDRFWLFAVSIKPSKSCCGL